uniref:DAGKc domain-containing protein n=1 Tax=Trichobilharzia regenti TaxID=157069 RepID=A0AA85KJQ4_TRIRE|nr:unnamed protein product [Trichobilharzia regenti]
MAHCRMSAVWRVLVTHPKKIVVGAVGLAYGYDFAAEKYSSVLHREICSQVSSENYKTTNCTQSLRRLTVFVNPFSRRGKLLKEFENNVAPILNLSGLDVQMVYIDTDSEIKDFVGVLDPSSTDGILVAGDDNLIQKVVTGLLRRSDFKTSSLWMLPVGAVPLGIWNRFVSSLYEKTAFPKWCYNSLHPVLEQKTTRRNLLEVKVISGENQQTVDQSSESSITTYSLLGIEWNIWRDIELGGGCGASGKYAKPKSTNDHRGVLSTLSITSPRSWTRNFGALWRSSWYWLQSSSPPSSSSSSSENSSIPPPPEFFSNSQNSMSDKKSRIRVKLARVIYHPVCTGCSKCWQKKLMSYKTPNLEETKKSNSLLSKVFGFSMKSGNHTPNAELKRKQKEVQQQMEDKSCIDNPDCEEERLLEVKDASGFTITPDGDHIRLDIFHHPTSYWEHIHQFRSWLLSQPYTFQSDSQTVFCDKVCLYPIVSENEFYWIDNDYFEARPIEVNVRRDAINLYM